MSDSSRAGNEPPPTVDATTRTPDAGGASQTVAAPLVQRDLPPPAIPGYEILSELGRGGMGVVYMARHLKLNRIVALKMILAGEYASQADLARFLTEAEAVAALQHPNIVQIFEIGQHNGLPYFTLEYVEGGSLTARVRDQPMAPVDAAVLVEQLARGTAFAHAKGIVHRDLKPDNVLLANDHTPKIADFGLAKRTTSTGGGLTRTGAVLGTPSYMAPEQAGGSVAAVGTAADVYSLGAILYRLVTGRPPFQAATSMDTILQVASVAPVPPRQLNLQVPRDLETICLKCLRKEPEKRYPSAEALADDLNRFRTDRPIVARPIGPLERAWLWSRRNRSLAAALGAVAATLVIGTTVSVALAAWALVSADRAKKQSEQVLKEQERTRDALTAETRRRRQVRAALDIVAGGAVNDLLARRSELEPNQRAFLEKALALYQDLVQDVGDHADTIRGAADGASSVAQIQQRLGRFPESEAAYRMALGLFRRLESFAPDRDYARSQQGVVWNNLGNLLRSMGRPREAEEALRHALDNRADGDSLSLARTQMNLALVQELNGDLVNAEKGYLAVLALVEPAGAGSPISADALDLLAGCCLNLGSARITLGRSADAVDVLKKAVHASRLLLKLAPKSTDHRNKLAQSLHNLAGSQFATGDRTGADAAIREAIEVERALVNDFPGVPDYRNDLAKHCDRLATFLRQTGRGADALPLAREAVRESARAAAGRPEAAELMADEAGHRENLATLLAESEQFDEAEPEMRRAQACWAKVKDPRYALNLPYSRLNMMRMLYDQKKHVEMKAEASTLAAELDAALEGTPSEWAAYRIAMYYSRAAGADDSLAARAFAASRRAAKAGAFRQSDRWQQLTQGPWFEAVRKNPGFADLLAEVKNK